MDDPLNRKIDEDLLPVMIRRKTFFIDGNPLRKRTSFHLYAADGSLLAEDIPYHWAMHIAGELNKQHVDKDRKESKHFIARIVVEGKPMLMEKKYAIGMGRDLRPFVGLRAGYKKMLNHQKKIILSQIIDSVDELPIRKQLHVTVILTINKIQPVRLPEFLLTVVDLFMVCGIIINERQIDCYDGSRINRITGSSPTAEIIIRTW